MPISFFSCYEKTFNKCGYLIGENNKKNFGKIRPIERSIEESFSQNQISQTQKEQLQSLCSTIRNWLNSSRSHKHRFKGVELYESIKEIATLIPILRRTKDHKVLQQIQSSLASSLQGLQTDYEALKNGQIILNQLTDLLYGDKDDKGIRHTQDYKIQADSQKIKQQVEQVLEQSQHQYKTHSAQMRGYLRHFQNTYQNWQTHLFTCYDYPDIPNDNNRLELSHSQMKKQYRRITGQQCTAKYLKIHGEQAAFMLAHSHANNKPEQLADLLRQTDYEQLKEQKVGQRFKSKMRASCCATKARLAKTLQQIKELWDFD